jgi:hypothetical protein
MIENIDEAIKKERRRVKERERNGGREKGKKTD